jgi:diguanylate cyclase (GGDEF)-like protein
MNLSALLNQLIELTGNVSNAYTIALYKVDKDRKILVLRHHISLSLNFNTDAKIKFGEGPIGSVAQSKQPFLAEDFQNNPTKLCIYKKKENLKSFLAIPVISNDLEGVLIIDSKESYSFSAKQQKIIAGLANQMAWQLNQEKKYSVKKRLPKSLFRDLISYCRFIAESKNKNIATERLSDVPSSILACDAYAVIWFDSNEVGRVYKFRGFNEDKANISIHLGKSLAGSCAKNQCPILLSNTANRQSTIFNINEEEEPFSSLMAAPISFNNQFYGVVVCGAKNAESFSELELNYLTLMTYSAASSFFCAETREQWDYNKNLDQIIGIPNHRFIVQHSNALEKDLLINGSSACFLSLKVNNLPEIYTSFGIKSGDLLQRGIAAKISSALPSPKYIFKFSDTTYIVILLNQELSKVQPLKTQLEDELNKAPFFVDGKSMQIHAELGISCYPANGKTLSQLIGASLPKNASKLASKTELTL